MDLSILVLDSGTSSIKAGFGGDSAPRVEIPTLLGQPRHPGVNGAMFGLGTDNFIGDAAAEHQGLLTLQRPITRGVVTDWDGLQHLWQHTVQSVMQLSCEEHPVILTETADNTREDREKMVQIAFEVFNFPSVVVANASTLALFSTGRSTGLVVDSGAGRTHVAPVWEGYMQPHYVRRVNIGGDDVTAHLRAKLRGDGYPISTARDMAAVKSIKEETCYISLNVDHDLEYCKTSKSIERLVALPDGQQVFLNDHQFTVPEILFGQHDSALDWEIENDVGSKVINGNATEKSGTNVSSRISTVPPSKIEGPGQHLSTAGLPDTIHECIQSCEASTRAELYGSIVLAGGNTMFKKFDERIQQEVAKRAPAGTPVRCMAFPGRRYATWQGGSVIAAMESFSHMWVSKNEYDDYGASVIHRKC